MFVRRRYLVPGHHNDVFFDLFCHYIPISDSIIRWALVYFHERFHCDDNAFSTNKFYSWIMKESIQFDDDELDWKTKHQIFAKKNWKFDRWLLLLLNACDDDACRHLLVYKTIDLLQKMWNQSVFVKKC